jgi:hypothetical protein
LVEGVSKEMVVRRDEWVSAEMKSGKGREGGVLFLAVITIPCHAPRTSCPGLGSLRAQSYIISVRIHETTI